MQQKKYESVSDKDLQSPADFKTLKRLQSQAKQDDELLASYEGQVNKIFKIASTLQCGQDDSKSSS